MRVILHFIIGCLTMIFLGCNNKKTAGGNQSLLTHGVYYSPPKTPAVFLDEMDFNKYCAQKYWSDFDFSDSTQVSLSDSVYLGRLLTEWVILLNGAPEIGPSCVEDLMTRAKVSNLTFEKFISAIQIILADPNSPLRDDELYIPVLKAQIENPYIDDAKKELCCYHLKLLEQNRLGFKANDFEYTLADGRSGALYDLKTEYTLLFFNDPLCENCQAIKNDITVSKILSDLIDSDRLKVLALYPYEDKEEWYRYRNEIPEIWINGYDKDCTILSKSLYDLSVVPALYLLDRNKTVVIKNCNDITIVENFLEKLL